MIDVAQLVDHLEALGYVFTVEGERVRFHHDDLPAVVRSRMVEALGHRDEMRTFIIERQRRRTPSPAPTRVLLNLNQFLEDLWRQQDMRRTLPCGVCGSSDWWQRESGGWVCGTCHPKPGCHGAGIK